MAVLVPTVLAINRSSRTSPLPCSHHCTTLVRNVWEWFFDLLTWEIQRMPVIKFGDKEIECQHNENLRRVLMAAKLPLYNGVARHIHCRGIGTCGTCALEVTGPVSETTAMERWRLQFPPHKKGEDLRLACQCRVLGDLEIRKRSGLWGSG